MAKRLSQTEVRRIIDLRKIGHSLNEIRRLTGHSNSTVLRYIAEIVVLPEYRKQLREKQGGSILKAKRNWKNAQHEASILITRPSRKDRLLVLASLYWGEGTKSELNLLNTDPSLIKVSVRCLKELGIDKSDLRVSIRTYEDLDRDTVITHWARVVGIPKKKILNVDVLKGRKKGKLKYGMCRVRVTKGARHFKLIMSLIEEIRRKFQ